MSKNNRPALGSFISAFPRNQFFMRSTLAAPRAPLALHNNPHLLQKPNLKWQNHSWVNRTSNILRQQYTLDNQVTSAQETSETVSAQEAFKRVNKQSKQRKPAVQPSQQEQIIDSNSPDAPFIALREKFRILAIKELRLHFAIIQTLGTGKVVNAQSTSSKVINGVGNIAIDLSIPTLAPYVKAFGETLTNFGLIMANSASPILMTVGRYASSNPETAVALAKDAAVFIGTMINTYGESKIQNSAKNFTDLYGNLFFDHDVENQIVNCVEEYLLGTIDGLLTDRHTDDKLQDFVSQTVHKMFANTIETQSFLQRMWSYVFVNNQTPVNGELKSQLMQRLAEGLTIAHKSNKVISSLQNTDSHTQQDLEEMILINPARPNKAFFPTKSSLRSNNPSQYYKIVPIGFVSYNPDTDYDKYQVEDVDSQDLKNRIIELTRKRNLCNTQVDTRRSLNHNTDKDAERKIREMKDADTAKNILMLGLALLSVTTALFFAPGVPIPLFICFAAVTAIPLITGGRGLYKASINKVTTQTPANNLAQTTQVADELPKTAPPTPAVTSAAAVTR